MGARWLRRGAAPVSAVVVGQLLSGPVAALLAGLLAVLGERGLRARRRRHDRKAERTRALEACAVLSAELRTGRTAGEALAAAAAATVPATATAATLPGTWQQGSVRRAESPLAGAFAEAAASSRWGGDVAAALERPADRSAAPDLLRGLAACWRVCNDTGSGLAAAVDRLEEALRTEQGQRDAVEAELAGPRATAGLLAFLPLAGTALAAGLGARPLHVLLHTPLGTGALVLGVTLDLLGVWWTARLVVGAGGEP